MNLDVELSGESAARAFNRMGGSFPRQGTDKDRTILHDELVTARNNINKRAGACLHRFNLLSYVVLKLSTGMVIRSCIDRLEAGHPFRLERTPQKGLKASISQPHR